MNSHDYKAISELAQDIAREAGQLALKYKAEGLTNVTTKSSEVDMVTEADKACEELIVKRLTEARPQDGLKGEEGADKPTDSGITWHIDPIDGTTNYLYGMPFAVSMGAAIDDEPVVGVIYAPFADEMFAAHLGGGATRNGEIIRVNDIERLELALIGTGLYYDADVRTKQAEQLVGIVANVRDLRRIGAASLDLCAVACGQTDGYFELGVNSWDVAAGMLIAAEAGATISTPFKADWDKATQMVVAAPGIAGVLEELVGEGPGLS